MCPSGQGYVCHYSVPNFHVVHTFLGIPNVVAMVTHLLKRDCFMTAFLSLQWKGKVGLYVECYFFNQI